MKKASKVEAVRNMASERFDFLRNRREQIYERIRAACERVGRALDEVEVLAVSKTVDIDDVILARKAGYRSFGENRAQELVRKLRAFEAAGIEAPPFDMIGNLQTNKVPLLVGNVRQIQSVASLRAAKAISARAERIGTIVSVLLEANVSGEPSKSGFSARELLEMAGEIEALPAIMVRGLMTMAPARNPDLARQTFRELVSLRSSLEETIGAPLSELSFGMSDDFEIAIEEGSTLIRLGRVVFDEDYTFKSALS